MRRELGELIHYQLRQLLGGQDFHLHLQMRSHLLHWRSSRASGCIQKRVWLHILRPERKDFKI